MLSSPHRFVLFSRYHSSTINPYNHLRQLLQSSINHKCLLLSKQAHARLFPLGLCQDSFLATKLISAYSISGLPTNSRLVFNSFHIKNIFLYNSMINEYAKTRLFKEGFGLFNQMCTHDNVSPDDFTLATLAKMSGEHRDIKLGEMIHGKSVKMGLVSDIIVANSVMAMYGKCENFGYVRKLFDEMPNRSPASWNVLLSGKFMFNKDVWELVKQMIDERIRLDGFTVSNLLPLCESYTGKWDYGREIHSFVLKNEMGFDSDVYVGSCLIDMYSKRKNVNVGRRVFELMNCRNVVAWTAMITGYVQNGCSEEALLLFREMQLRDGVEPNRISLVSILLACSSLASLMEGKQIHAFAIRRKFFKEVSLCNAIIDMYLKCGSLDYAGHVFDDDSCSKDTISWSSMISGYGLNGKGNEAIYLFYEMLKLRIKPDDITLVGILSACARTGMVDEGLKIYKSTINSYGISPTLEICACLVDILGRAGKIDEALEFIKTMPVKPGPSVWGSLFGACAVHENLEVQELAYKALCQLEPENPSNYISLSNVHASSERWDVVAELRTRLKDKGLRKLPGCSSITLNSESYSFHVADKAHPSSALIYVILDDLILLMKGDADISDFESIL